jgi:phosphotransferase system, enzyme I, PtsP
MLKTLRRIVQQVSAAQDSNEALEIVVKQVKEAMNTQACSIYLLDHHSTELILMATEGLNKAMVGKVHMHTSEGLIGLVAQREEPINLEDAPAHPQFVFLAPLGEERFHAFLGVPIIHHRQLQGVLVAQHQQKRRYDEAEEAFLITLSAQLAGVIAHAEASGGHFMKLSQPVNVHDQRETMTLNGHACVPGVGVGVAVVVYPKALLSSVPSRITQDIDGEIALFEDALQATREEIQLLRRRLEETLAPDEIALFDAYLGILDKASLGNEVISEIREGHWAQGALRRVIERHIHHFATMEDEYLQERAADIKDLGRRVLSYLQKKARVRHDYPEHVILVGDEVMAADLAEIPEGRLVAVVSGKGSSNSHVAILARAMGVPTVMGVTGTSLSSLDEQELVVDGYYGHIYLSPSEELREEFKLLVEEERELNADLAALRDLPAKTPDGHVLNLYVNTGVINDAGLSLSVGAEGVGLFRTEISFMVRERFPSEQEQKIVYRQLLQAFAPRPVVMRTLDIGGDKALPYFPVEEVNPVLGWRGLRITLDHPELFLVQARAMLRASESLNNLSIMLPMVTTVTELDHALHLLQRAHLELLEEGHNILWPAIGVMVEVPSAVYQAGELAKRVDFVSVGSNDLTQYLLAVDRNNARVASLYDALHPAVLQALQQVVTKTHQQRKKVSICGEMANDPVAVILLLGMGFDTLSMNAGSLLRVKWVIRNFTLQRARELLQEVLVLENPTMIRVHLERALDQAGLGGLIRAGKH